MTDDEYRKLCKAIEAEEGIPVQHTDLRILVALLREEIPRTRALAAAAAPPGGRVYDQGFLRGRADAYEEVADKLQWILQGSPFPESGPLILRREIGEE